MSDLVRKHHHVSAGSEVIHECHGHGPAGKQKCRVVSTTSASRQRGSIDSFHREHFVHESAECRAELSVPLTYDMSGFSPPNVRCIREWHRSCTVAPSPLPA